MKKVLQKNFTATELAKMALCIALCCVTAYLSFPLPFTPGMVTALTIAMSLTAYILTPKQTFTVILIYVLMGGIGLPVFAGGAGLGKLFGPVGGFYFAWIIAYPVLSALKGTTPNFKRYLFVNILTTMPITYAGGVISMMIVMDLNFAQALTMAVLPYIPGDIMKAAAAAFVAVKINLSTQSLV